MTTFAGMNEVRFTKMHGLGNDYVYFNCMPCPEDELPQFARRVSDRHCSVGGDGIILILPSSVADFRMRIFNADGSEARMCGNGSRCVGKFVYDSSLTDRLTITLETLSGIKTLRLHPNEAGEIDFVTVDMGPCVVSEQMELKPGVTVVPADMGNPHAVMFIDCDPADAPVLTLGPELEHHPVWPDRANIEFARVVSDSYINMRVWERGSGETMACGTGACATAMAAMATGRVNPHTPVTVKLPGGELVIERDPSTGHTLMTGPAVTAFKGVLS